MVPLQSPYVNDATFDSPFRHLFFEWLLVTRVIASTLGRHHDLISP